MSLEVERSRILFVEGCWVAGTPAAQCWGQGETPAFSSWLKYSLTSAVVTLGNGKPPQVSLGELLCSTVKALRICHCPTRDRVINHVNSAAEQSGTELCVPAPAGTSQLLILQVTAVG